ncbi:hypothetical protein BWD12_09155 [Leptospira santarosai serovar Bananal]|nr:hypothetical protein B2G51_09830 [Leptospira santarosai]OLY66088.1 hypothetical protein BWD11_00385 [Leptospira santarosai serovar Grippotyphosa]ONF79412.1 hypothetical protein BWD12_09155 [Leptospira santarosai serovar Bananal]ONF87110.1 hypothetical protein BWD13_08000 [Leptospira santarosai serovar Grippotyphosa]
MTFSECGNFRKILRIKTICFKSKSFDTQLTRRNVSFAVFINSEHLIQGRNRIVFVSIFFPPINL